MVDAAVSFTIEKLGEFVTQQINIRTGVKDGIEWLRDELGYLLISVRAAEAHQQLDHIRRWTESVKEVANQAVIILERFSAQQEEHASHEHGGVLDRMRNFICICKKEANLFDIGKEIQSLNKTILRIKNRRDEYRITDIITATPAVQQRKRTVLRAASFDYKDDVIGFEADYQTLLAQLDNPDPSLGFISIHGMGGLGKSTLASKLYHSSELSHFKSRAWVCVSEDYDITNVLRKIIKCFNRDEQDLLNKMEEGELLRHLREILLDGDHYLAVIDDIWDIEFWKRIKNAFPDKKNGSRVIITTRNKLVAREEFVEEQDGVHVEDVADDYARHAIYNGIGEYFKLLGPNSDSLNLRSLALTTQTASLELEEIKLMYTRFQYLTTQTASLEIEEIKLMYTRFQYLKVLDLTSVHDSKGIPEEIGDLVLLKFLSLMGSPYSREALVIPPSIGKLKRLQTLHASDYGIYVFPKEICELKELRHIIFYGNQGNLNIGSDQTKLQTISEIKHKEWCHIDTNNWTNLHTLVISGEYHGEEESSLESMENLTSLRTLVLVHFGFISTMQPLSSCKHLNKAALWCRIKDVAELSFLPDSITDLTLNLSGSTEDPMPILGSLSNLTSLWLHECGDKLVFGAYTFPCLQFLKIQPAGGLFQLEVDDGALPSLRAFTLYYHYEMAEIPPRLLSLPPAPEFSGHLW
ncbi:uncharacterized protein LOC108213970 [Daucus carota subsp. sativus]|uniref:uncharacterized protein LOC108213970 n=1 Tax=Daucus carota subsp. sativus TaxID=79200 RepID=UPI0030830F1B